MQGGSIPSLGALTRLRTCDIIEAMKTCLKCKVSLPLDAFAKNKTKPDGLQGMCRSCRKVWYDNYYRTSPKEKARLTRNRRSKVERFRELIREKKSVPCTDCGNTFPYYVMDFDHLEDKSFTISKAANLHSLERVAEEINKCEVVCSNCHRERTHSRGS